MSYSAKFQVTEGGGLEPMSGAHNVDGLPVGTVVQIAGHHVPEVTPGTPASETLAVTIWAADGTTQLAGVATTVRKV